MNNNFVVSVPFSYSKKDKNDQYTQNDMVKTLISKTDFLFYTAGADSYPCQCYAVPMVSVFLCVTARDDNYLMCGNWESVHDCLEFVSPRLNCEFV